MENLRTDLAIELCRDLRSHTPHLDGIECSKERFGSLFTERVRVTSEQGAALLGKPMGEYQTVSTGKIWLDDRETFKEKVQDFARILSPLLKKGKENGILVVGLGNESITADAIGPEAIKNLIVTRHIRKERPLIFENLGLWDVCAFAPGVLGQTGIESADLVRSAVSAVQPDLVIAIDALASREPERLVTTVQLGTGGIQPGAGIGNARPTLGPNELGIPVLSVGVPTVVDAATLATDVLRRFADTEIDSEKIRRAWEKSQLNFFVTPKETDQIIRVMGSFLGYGINLALNPELSFEDMLSLIG